MAAARRILCVLLLLATHCRTHARMHTTVCFAELDKRGMNVFLSLSHTCWLNLSPLPYQHTTAKQRPVACVLLPLYRVFCRVQLTCLHQCFDSVQSVSFPSIAGVDLAPPKNVQLYSNSDSEVLLQIAHLSHYSANNGFAFFVSYIIDIEPCTINNVYIGSSLVRQLSNTRSHKRTDEGEGKGWGTKSFHRSLLFFSLFPFKRPA